MDFDNMHCPKCNGLMVHDMEALIECNMATITFRCYECDPASVFTAKVTIVPTLVSMEEEPWPQQYM